MVAYYVASPVAAPVARASMILFFLVTAMLGVASLLPAGLLRWDAAIPVAVGIPLVFAGSAAGAALFRRSGAQHYNQVALVVLTLAAIASLARALPGLTNPLTLPTAPAGGETAGPTGRTEKGGR